MSEEEIICMNCGENISLELYKCAECFNQICEKCANVCRKCRNNLYDGCYYEHKKKCK